MPKVGPEAGLRKIGEYLAEVSRLRELKHVQGEHQREVLNQKIIAFIRNAFDDSQETIKEYDRHVNIHFAIAGKQKTSQEKEIDYQRNLNKMETMLQSYHEELEMVNHNNVSKKKISYDPKKSLHCART